MLGNEAEQVGWLAAGDCDARMPDELDTYKTSTASAPLPTATLTFTHSHTSPQVSSQTPTAYMIANMQATRPSPQRSRASSRSKSPLSIDLSDLPPLVEPSPPSNTLIITVCTRQSAPSIQLTRAQNLLAPELFQPSTLTEIRQTIDPFAKIHTWAPLKSFKRIVVSFFDIESAIQIRQTLDGETIMGYRIRVYFGMNTPLNPSDQHLPLPKSDKLFFISPPPSPPMGWEMRDESEPNKVVHPEDLAEALAKLHARHTDAPEPMSEDEVSPITRRRRTGSTTIVYHPEDHGDSPHLPQIAVEDTTEAPSIMTPDEMEGVEGAIATHKAQGVAVSTARPPVELME